MNLEQRLARGPGAGALPDFAPAAEAAGLLDVAVARMSSPVGELMLAATLEGLVRVAYLDWWGEDAVLSDLAARVSPRVLAAPRRLDRVRSELEEYFSGRRRAFAVAVDLRLAAGFGRRVLEATAQIGYGSVSSYGEVAAAAGSPRGSRAAGNALGANPVPIVVPCHRVLRAGGALGGYTGGADRKAALLELERRTARGAAPE